MKRRLLTLLIILIISVLAFSACDKFFEQIPPEEYSVTFETNGGNAMEATKVARGGLLTRPEDPTRGYDIFDGWFADADFTDPWDFDKDKVNSNITLYAKWTNHVHTGGTATCTDKPTCSVCGVQYGSPKGHTVARDAAVAPTCTSTGLTEGAHCDVCGIVLKAQETVPVTSHTPVTVPAVEATCTSTGLTAGSKCSVCHTTLVEQTETPVKAHSYDNEHDADCNVCGFERDVACQHTETIVVPGKAATCETAGLTDGEVCANDKCGVIVTEQQVIPALGHAWGEWEVTVEPTYETTGLKTRTCSVCGETETEVIDMLVPDEKETLTIYYYTTEWTSVNLYAWNEDGYVVAWPGTAMTAVEGQEGWYTVTLELETLEGLNIIFNNGENQTADLVYNGLTYWVGHNGYATKAEADEAIANQTPVDPEKTQWYVRGDMNDWNTSTPLVYDDNGNASVTLSLTEGVNFKVATANWSDNKNHGYSADLGANFKEGRENGNIEVVVGGTYKITVTADGKLVIESVHVCEYTEEVTTAATCTTTGVKTFTCECGDTYTEVIPVDATAHNYVGVVTTAPTCTEEGVKTYTCTHNDEHTYTEVIAKLGHIDEDGNSYCDRCETNLCTNHVWTNATCETPKTCENCGIVEGEALGHTPAEAVKENETSATCTEDGSYDLVVYCSVCLTHVISKETVTVKATGHEYGEWEVYEETETTIKYTRACACGEEEHKTVCKVTVYFKNTYNWTTVNTYSWIDGKGDQTNAWPGNPATKLDNGWWSYSMVVESTAGLKVIFNNGNGGEGNQTSDLVYDANKIYWVNNTAYATMDEANNASVTHKMYLMGTINGWTAKEEYLLTESEDKATWTITVDFKKNDEFKIFNSIGNSWHSDNGTNNMVIAKDGKYLITYTVKGDKITVEDVTPHVCEYTEEITTAPTCTTEGLKTFTCECSESYTEAIPVDTNAHNYVGTVTTQPTCTENGVKTYTCSHNSEHTYTEPVTKLGHIDEDGNNWCDRCEKSLCGDDHKWIDATCEAPKTCSKCGTVEGEALGHKWQDATCIAPKTCSVCGKTEGEIDLTTHVWSKWTEIKAPNYVEDGEKSRECSVCHNVETEAIPKRVGTEWYIMGIGGNWTASANTKLVYDKDGNASITKVVTSGTTFKIATSDWSEEIHAGNMVANSYFQADASDSNAKKNILALASGEFKFTVSLDGKLTIEVIRIDKPVDLYFAGSLTNGAWGESTEILNIEDDGTYWIIREVKAGEEFKIAAIKNDWQPQYGASKLTDKVNFGGTDNIVVKVGGTYKFTITKDGKLVIESVHTCEYKEEITTAPTCMTEGLKTFTCECGKSYTEVIAIDVNAHAWDEGVITKPATCSAVGVMTYTCKHNDKHTRTEDIAINPNAHSWSEWITDTPATEDTEGTKHRECDRCDSEETGIIPTLEHVHSYTDVVTDPTCTEKGYTTHTCKCGESYVDTYVDAIGHTEIIDKAVAPTCTETGLTEGKHCDVCKTIIVKQETVKANGHSFTNYVSDKNATCTEDGTKTAKCDNCEETDTVADADSKLGHSFTNYVSDKNATCTKDGTKTSKCDNCEKTDTVADAGSKLGHSYPTNNSKCERCDSFLVTIFYNNHLNWNNVSIWVWDNSGHNFTGGNWPGKTMTKGDFGIYYYSFETTSANSKNINVIFSNNGSDNGKTPDLKFDPTKPFRGKTAWYPDSYRDLFLVGAHSDWKFNNNYKLTTDSDGNLTIIAKLAKGTAFKISNDPWEMQYTQISSSNVKFNTDKDGNLVTTYGCEYKFTVTKDGKLEINALHDWIDATCTAPKTCSICGITEGSTISHIDENHDHKCDYNCNTTMGTHAAAEGTHVCEYCGGVVTQCADNNKDHNCDVCGAKLSEHTPAEAVKENIKNPTCTVDGKYDSVVYCAICGTHEISRKTIVVSATGHTPVTDKAVDPTCTNTGLTEGSHCSACNEVLVKQTVVDALGHSYNKNVTAPTCTAEGYTTHTCSLCQHSYVDSYVDATGHSYNAVVTDPTCEEQGYTTHTCTNGCGSSYVDTYVDALGHDYTAAYGVVDGDLKLVYTCQNDNSHVYYGEKVSEGTVVSVSNEADLKTVLTSGYSVVLESGIALTSNIHLTEAMDVVINLNGKTINAAWNNEAGVVDVLWAQGAGVVVTITGNGTMTCTGNGESTAVVSATDGAKVVIENGRYASNGSACIYATRGGVVEILGGEFSADELYYGKSYLLDVNEAEELGTITVKGGIFHNFDPANHTNDGASNTNKVADGYHSIGNNGVYTVSAHSYKAVVTDPTCVDKGFTTHTCVCGDSYVDTYVDANGHTDGETVVENKKAPTCTATGSYDNVVYCTVCDVEVSRETVTVNALGHKYDAVVTDPTCTTDGYTTYKCSVCGDTYVDNKVASKGHVKGDAVIEKEVKPTCETKGSYETAVYCTVCDAELERTTAIVSKLGHTVVTDKAVAPTCTETGLTEGSHCSVCNKVLVKQTVVDSLGHTVVVDKAVDATCTETGLTEGSHCSVCNVVLTKQEVTNALDHNYAEYNYAVVNGKVKYVSLCENDHNHVDTKDVDKSTVIPVGDDDLIQAALESGYSVYLTGDIALSSSLLIEGYVVSIDLNGHALTADWESEVCEVIWARGEGTKVTINGNGSMISGKNSETNSVVSATDKAVVTINGGYYYSESFGAVIFATRSGVVNIYGGTFEAAEAYYGVWYVLDINEAENDLGDINVYGGEFVNYDPANCKNDGADTNKVSAISHSLKNGSSYVVSEHTYENDDYYCDGCGANRCTHNYTAVVTAPTCTAKGYTTHTCSLCQHSYVDSYVDATGHNYKAVVTDPTCEEQGYTTHTCTNGCGSSYVDTYVDALGHDYTAAYGVVDGDLKLVYTCQNDNSHVYYGEKVSEGTVVSVSNEADLKTVLTSGYSVVLESGIALTSNIHLTEAMDVVINLNGKTINAAWNNEAGVVDVLWAQGAGVVVTITGNGTMTCTGNGESTAVVSATDGAKVVIENGRYASNGSACIYATRGGVVEILGGEFSADELYYGKSYLLDVNEAEELGTITVKGGIFHNFDPANHTNDGASNTNKVADGYHSIGNNGVYTVSAHSYKAVVTDPTCVDKGFTTHTCVCGDSYVDTYVDELGHNDSDNDHKCNNCGTTLTKCTDVDPADHMCDICGDKVSYCEDNTNNHKCDLCGKTLSVCRDVETPDHKCDLCGTALSECTDVKPADHKCDICGTTLSECEDVEPWDHECDICGKTLTECEDANKNHKCDTCNDVMSKCEDANKNHFCDWCGVQNSQCMDVIRPDHNCDWCGEKISVCEDNNKDHKCDTCGKALSICRDEETPDHKCDLCGTTLSECADIDSDHECDICFKSLSDCIDKNNNHKCDICNAKVSKCKDDDKNHSCDICGIQTSHCININPTEDHTCDWCGATLSTCEDNNKDHKCDNGCNKVFGEHVDTDKNHACDYGCSETIGACDDKDIDHDCDYGCDKVYGEHKPAENSHNCGYCGEKMSECSGGEATCYAYAVCETCGEEYGELKAHTFGEWMVAGESTKARECTVDGCEGAEATDLYDTTIYLVPNNNWKADGAWFALYTWNNSGNAWVKMEDTNNDGIYECKLPVGYENSTTVIFCRMNTDKTVLDWGSKWDQTVNIDISSNKAYTLFTVNEGDWNNANGSWSVGPHDHAYNAANCTTPMTCVLCNTTKGEANGHNYTSVVTAPTCEAAGYTTYTCHCGHSYIGDNVDALGHDMSDFVTTTAPSCTAEGVERSDCSRCDHYVTNVLEVVDHTHTTYTSNNNATCTSDGTKTSVCDVCGGDAITITNVGSALPHTEVVDAAVEATCTTAGKTEGKHCSVCEKVLVAQEIVPAKGHTEVVDQAVAPSCNKTGLTEGKHCSACGEVLIAQSEVPMVAHTYDDIYDAICNVCGYEREAACAHTETEVVPGHAATCTEAGLTDGSKCKKCGDTVVAQEVIKALGHTEVVDEAVAAGCETTGLTEGKHCSACNKVLVEQEVTKALGHKWNDGVITTAPTCAKDGVKTYTCQNDGTHTKTETVAAAGHTYGTTTYSWSSDYKTCTATRVCSKDNSHKDTATATITSNTVNATCAADGSTTYTATFDKDWATTQTKNVVIEATVSLKPNNNWLKDGARFAAYFYVNDSTYTWVNMTDANSDGVYECVIPNGYEGKNVIFCRMNPAKTTNDWTNKWNQTANLTLTSTQKVYKIVADTWSTGYWDSNSNIIYLVPNSNWKSANQWFAVYFFNNSTNKNAWVKMTDDDGDGVFEAVVPSGTWPNVLFCRMNGAYNVLSWDANGKDYVWDQTSDLTFSSSNNLYTVKEGTWSKGGGTWSKKS